MAQKRPLLKDYVVTVLYLLERIKISNTRFHKFIIDFYFNWELYYLFNFTTRNLPGITFESFIDEIFTVTEGVVTGSETETSVVRTPSLSIPKASTTYSVSGTTSANIST